MSAQIIDGKAVAKKYRKQIKAEVEGLKGRGINPALAVVIVGEDPASLVYVKNKKLDCEKCGIISEEIALPVTTTEQELLDIVDRLNRREDINGILVQLPLPKGINERKILLAIDPNKDVDAFHPYNVGLIMEGSFSFLPCTPAGVIALLDEYNVEIKGRECVVIGRSNIVGKPQAMLLLHRHGTVTICHSRTTNLAEVCRRADILVSAVGSPGLVTGDMVKEGAVVIDVAVNRMADGSLAGDVVYGEVSEKASYITPVPGGVGPMTRVMLLQNTLKATKLQNGIE